MKLTEKDYWLAFNVCGGFGPKRFALVLKYFGSAKKAWSASRDQWQKLRLPAELLKRLFNFRIKFDFISYKIRLEKYLITFVTLEDNNYPINLKKTENPPYLLYIKGRLLTKDSLAISVVGTRKISNYGREVVEKLVGSLVAGGLTIVSGLARGVDSLAHRTALKFGGRTLAVVGHGLAMVYPPENKLLAEQIGQKGALISQFPLDVLSLRGNFPCRNRTLAGLGLGTLVIEGTSDSGSLITAGYCQEFGRPVFAVPGPITSPLSEGPARLIKAGAKLVTSGRDIFAELNLSLPTSSFESGSQNSKLISHHQFNNAAEEKIWQVLLGGIKHIDEIIRETGLPSSLVASTLTSLELQGLVKNLGNAEYCL
jgi:DNA processing protein